MTRETVKYRGSALPIGAYRRASQHIPFPTPGLCEAHKDFGSFERVSSWEESTSSDRSNFSSDCTAAYCTDEGGVGCCVAMDDLYTRMDQLRRRNSYYSEAAASAPAATGSKGPPRRAVSVPCVGSEETTMLTSQSTWEDIFSLAPAITERSQVKHWHLDRVSPTVLARLLEEKRSGPEDVLL